MLLGLCSWSSSSPPAATKEVSLERTEDGDSMDGINETSMPSTIDGIGPGTGTGVVDGKVGDVVDLVVVVVGACEVVIFSPGVVEVLIVSFGISISTGVVDGKI